MHGYDKELEPFIPPDFDLNNYKDTETYTVYDWICALSERCYEDWITAAGHDPFDDEEVEITVQDCLTAYQPIIQRGSKHINDPIIKEIIEDCTCSIETIDEGYVIPRFGGGLICALVDLDTPDEILMERFREWVSFNRGQLKIPKHKIHSESEILRWHKYNVLPYMDLRIWNQINGIDLTDKIAGEILFRGDSRNKADLIKKKTRKIYSEISPSSFHNKLYWQAKVK